MGSLGCEAYLASKLGLQGFAKALQQEAIEDKNFALCRDGKSKGLADKYEVCRSPYARGKTTSD